MEADQLAGVCAGNEGGNGTGVNVNLVQFLHYLVGEECLKFFRAVFRSIRQDGYPNRSDGDAPAAPATHNST
jgi:hypothetical protein